MIKKNSKFLKKLAYSFMGFAVSGAIISSAALYSQSKSVVYDQNNSISTSVSQNMNSITDSTQSNGTYDEVDINSIDNKALLKPTPDFLLNSDGSVLNDQVFNNNYTIYNHSTAKDNGVVVETKTLQKVTLTSFKTSGLINSSFKSEITTVSPTDKLLSATFKDDNCFMVDWRKFKSDKEQLLTKHINDNIGSFVNGFELSISGQIVKTNVAQLSLVEASKTTFSVNVVFNNWFVNNTPQSQTIDKAFTIQLKETPTANHITLPALDLTFKNQQGKITIDDIKKVIASELNENKNMLPQATIPPSGSFTPDDINLTADKVIFNENSIIIQAFSIGHGDAELRFDQIELNYLVQSNKSDDNMLLWLIAGGSALVVLVILILLITFFIKRRKIAYTL